MPIEKNALSRGGSRSDLCSNKPFWLPRREKTLWDRSGSRAPFRAHCKTPCDSCECGTRRSGKSGRIVDISFEGRATGSSECPLYPEILQTYLSSLPTSGDKFALKYLLRDRDLNNNVRGSGQYQGWV